MDTQELIQIAVDAIEIVTTPFVEHEIYIYNFQLAQSAALLAIAKELAKLNEQIANQPLDIR